MYFITQKSGLHSANPYSVALHMQSCSRGTLINKKNDKKKEDAGGLWKSPKSTENPQACSPLHQAQLSEITNVHTIAKGRP